MALKYSVTHNGNTWNSSTDLSSIPISNGSVTTSMTSAGTKTLSCSGKVAANNIVIGAKTLNCSGKIMAGNVVIVAENSWDPEAHNRVGGRIFYVHSDNGATYTFYKYDGTVLSTQTVAGLADAYYYDVSGTKSADKFYVYDSTNGLATSMYWGWYGTQIGSSGVPPYRTDGIGYGKLNTNAVLTKGATEYTPNIWSYLTDINSANTGGCNDWFIGSMAEQNQLRSSGLVDWYGWYDSDCIWSSVELSSYYAYFWRYDNSEWSSSNKIYTSCVVPLRAF